MNQKEIPCSARRLMFALAWTCFVGWLAVAASGLPAGPVSPQSGRPSPAISIRKIEKFVDVGGRKLHACVYGSGSPAVVLVSGLGAPQTYWNPVIPELAAKTTVVTYDRAGVGKSELGSRAADGEQSVLDLQALLKTLAVPKPYILVGHSLGGSLVRIFASRYPETMGGLVLEETQHESIFEEMAKILRGKDRETFDQFLSGDYFADPENPKFEADFRKVIRDQVKACRPLPSMPLVVLMCPDRARSMSPMFSPEAIEELVKLDRALMNRLAAAVAGGRLIMVEGTGHDVHVDKPAALISPVKDIIARIRGEIGH